MITDDWLIHLIQPWDGHDDLYYETRVLYINKTLDEAVQLYKKMLLDKNCLLSLNRNEVIIESGTALFVDSRTPNEPTYIELYYGGNGPIPGEWIKAKYDGTKAEWGVRGPWWMPTYFGLKIPNKYKSLYERSKKDWDNWDVEKSLNGI